MSETNEIVARVTEPPQVQVHFDPFARQQFIASMLIELEHAYGKHGSEPWSRHEFYGVLKEEVDELWDDIKKDAPIANVLKEAMQIACVCLRFAETGNRYTMKVLHDLPLPCRASFHEESPAKMIQRLAISPPQAAKEVSDNSIPMADEAEVKKAVDELAQAISDKYERRRFAGFVRVGWELGYRAALTKGANK